MAKIEYKYVLINRSGESHELPEAVGIPGPVANLPELLRKGWVPLRETTMIASEGGVLAVLQRII